MSEKVVAVTGVGMVSPVGLTALQTCAAIRAGLPAFHELEDVLDSTGHPIVAATLPYAGGGQLPPALADRALEAAMEALEQVDVNTSDELVVAIVAAEPERPGQPLELGRLTSGLEAELGRTFRRLRIHAYPRGHAGAALALRDLSETLTTSAAAVGLVVGADSLLSAETLVYLERDGRLKSPRRPRGVIPGEAAVALVIESLESLERRRRRGYCRLAGIGAAIEPVPVSHDAPCLAEGLTSAVQSALANAGWHEKDVAHVYSDLNGEEYKAHEWMLVRCRALEDPTVTHPADGIGDVGAAALPLLIGVGAVAFSRRHAEFDRALALASSDFGLRGVVAIEAIEERAW
jgi:3-oxoacyl-[acyl-carrier-protein] synthase-1